MARVITIPKGPLFSMAYILSSYLHKRISLLSFFPGHCTVPQNVKLRPMRNTFFDLVKACEGVFLLCFLGQIVT